MSHDWSRYVWSLLTALAFGALAPTTASAQITQAGFGVDPFSTYYGFFLPRQAALAAQPSTTDTLNFLTAERQRYSATDRSALRDPVQPFGLDSLLGGDADPTFTRTRGVSRGRTSGRLARNGVSNQNLRGGGVPGYFNSVGSYYPGARGGQSANSNVSVIKSRGMGMGGFGGGMGGFGGGFGGFGS